MAVQWFGVFAITFMVTCYGLEKRSPIYVALFAIACLLSAVYAVMVASYPFVFAETVWAVVASRRYYLLVTQASGSMAPPSKP